MRLTILALLSSLACAQVPGTKLITPATILKKADGSAGGRLTIQGPSNELHAGEDFINSLAGNVANHYLWSLSVTSGKGLFRVSDGTGAGGCDSQGAQLLMQGAGGILCVTQQVEVGIADPRAYIRPGQFFTTNGGGTTINNIDTTGINSSVLVSADTGSAGYTSMAPTVLSLFAADRTTPQVRVNNSAGASTGGMIRSYDISGNVVNTINHLGINTTVGFNVNTGSGANSALTNSVFTLFAADGVTPQIRANNSAGASTGGMIRTYDISGNVVNTFNHLGLKSSIFSGSGTRCLQADNNGLVALAAAGCSSGSSFTGAWSSYTPSTTHLTSVSTTAASITSSKSTFVRASVTGTSDGSNPTISLPNTSASASQTLSCTITTGGATVNCTATFSGSTVVIGLYNNTALGNTIVYTIVVQGVYENT